MPTPVDVDTTERSIDSASREERVRRRAQEFYRLRGDRPDSALEDWLRVEEEIREAEEQAVDVASERFFSGERFARALGGRLACDRAAPRGKTFMAGFALRTEIRGK